MGNFARGKYTSVGQPVVDPVPEAHFGFGRVLATDSWVRFPGDNLDALKDDFERSFYPVRVDHYVGLAGVCRQKCGPGPFTAAP